VLRQQRLARCGRRLRRGHAFHRRSSRCHAGHVPEEGLDQNTLILFSSDNGAHAEGGHDSDFFDSNGPYTGIKRSLTDGGIRVPLLARWPAKIKPGAVSDHVSGFQDLLPTVAALSGASLEAQTDGLSFAPPSRAKEAGRARPSVWNFDEQGGKRAVLQWPWKLIHLNTGAGRDKAKNKAKSKPLEVQLFNLDQDIAEQNNVASQHPELLKQLEAKMMASWQEPKR